MLSISLVVWFGFMLTKSEARQGSSLVTPTSLGILRFRGGAKVPRGSLYELNPSYEPRAVTLGDLERQQGMQLHTTNMQENNQQRISWENESNAFTYQQRSPSLTERAQAFSTNLHRTSPTLSMGSLACIVIFILWRIPFFQHALQQYFVCSRFNIVHHYRYPALVLSALSHASPTHLLMNLWAFVNMGPSLRHVLLSNGGWPLWPFALGAALSGSFFFLLLSGGGGCMGLSGVTLAMLSVHARMYPQKEFVISRFVPIKLTGELALGVLFLWSLLGSLAPASGGSSVAHAAHLGGLVYGLGYYELWNRRHRFQGVMRSAKTTIPTRNRGR